MSSLDDSLAAETPESRRAQLRADVLLMRELGVMQWRDVVLGAAPVATTESTQQSISPEQARARELAERQRIAMAASGGPVRRLSGIGQ